MATHYWDPHSPRHLYSCLHIPIMVMVWCTCKWSKWKVVLWATHVAWNIISTINNYLAQEQLVSKLEVETIIWISSIKTISRGNSWAFSVGWKSPYSNFEFRFKSQTCWQEWMSVGLVDSYFFSSFRCQCKQDGLLSCSLITQPSIYTHNTLKQTSMTHGYHMPKFLDVV